tara:strand:+ start:22667 stop:24334 length:1668 start_codon:yes stop_codon:yes gene_type:complete
MNRKLFSSVLFTLFTLTIYSQTIVSTSPENKKIVLEEYTGIHCVWCPSGHEIAQTLQDNNPGDVFLVNIHVGGYANPGSGEPDFRTPFGTAIANEAGVAFYPSGSVNRHVFSGGATAMDRNAWTGAANTTMGQASYVNVGVEADIDVSTNIMTVHVEAYYTGNSPENTNLLNIALLQNNTLGPQTGGDMGNEYNHMHRLVHLVTGQWGVSISPTTTGTFIDETFTYSIPEDYNSVPVQIEDLEVVAFITEDHQELPSGSGAYPTYSGFAHANDAKARYVEDILPQCGFDITPKVNIQNFGENDITNLEITYSVNGGSSQVYNWSGLLESLQNESIELPAISYIAEEINTIEVSISDDDDNSNNNLAYDFNISPEYTNTVNMILNTDNGGSQCTWDLMNSNGEVLFSGGPYENNESIQETFELIQDCYRFRIFDTAGDGGGSVVIYDSESEVIYNSPGNYDEGEEVHFRTIESLGTNDNKLQHVIIYPNPTKSILNIENAEYSMIKIYDLLGRVVLSKNNISLNERLNVSTLSSGTYLIKISKNNIIITDKFIINK